MFFMTWISEKSGLVRTKRLKLKLWVHPGRGIYTIWAPYMQRGAQVGQLAGPWVQWLAEQPGARQVFQESRNPDYSWLNTLAQKNTSNGGDGKQGGGKK